MPRRETFVFALLMVAKAAHAQTDAEMEAGRRLFAEGMTAENAGHCPEALEKYRQVQAVKDTANIRFRIGACSEATGQLRAAVRAYDGAIRLGRGDPQAKDVTDEATKRIEALAPKMGRLRVKRPDGASVQIDNEPVADADLAEPLWMDPGMHGVTATSSGKKPFHMDVAVKEKTETNVEIAMEPDVPPPPPVEPSSVPKIIGWSLVGLGGVLAIGGVISIVVRETSIGTITGACNPTCALARQMELQSTRDRALVAGPLAGALFVGGGVAAATGAILLFVAPKKTTGLVPVVGPAFSGLAYRGAF
jgi:hypothetical protein